MSTDSLRNALRELRIELQIVNDRVAVAAGLNPHDLDVLDVIDREGPCTPSHLAHRTGHQRATLTGILARLAGQGWIARTAHPADKRSALVDSSERVHELRALYTHVDAIVDAFHQSVPPSESAALASSLNRLAELLRHADPPGS